MFNCEAEKSRVILVGSVSVALAGEAASQYEHTPEQTLRDFMFLLKC